MHDLCSFRNYFFVTEPDASAIHLATVDLQERGKDSDTLLSELSTAVEEVVRMEGTVVGTTTDNASAELLSSNNLELQHAGSWLPGAGFLFFPNNIIHATKKNTVQVVRSMP